MKKQEVKTKKPAQEVETGEVLDWGKLITEKQVEAEKKGERISWVTAYWRIYEERGMKGEIVNMRAVMR
jgi:hypothetical protein